MKQIKKSLLIFIFAIFSYEILANINHAININKKYNYDFDNGVEINGIKESILTIEYDILRIKMINNTEIDKDINEYVIFLERLVDDLSNFKFMKYNGIIYLKQNDLYDILHDYGELHYVDLLNMYKKLGQLYPSLKDNEKEFIQHIYTMMLSSNYINDVLSNNYVYSSSINMDLDFTVNTILLLFQEKLNTIHYINELIIGSGKINE